MSDNGAYGSLGLFDGVLARGPVREAVSDRGWLQALLDVEGALARAQARAGLFPSATAEEIALACRAENFDIPALGRAAAETGNPVPALVRALTAAVPEAAAAQVHRGATSQDIVDTAAMLVAKRALVPLMADLDAAAHAAAALAIKHRTTLMAGRTLLQQALPITFGLKAAGWLSGLDDAATRLEQLRRTRLAVQLGGAAGTLSALGHAGPEVVGYLGDELGLVVPLLPWHTARGRVAELAGALGVAAGALGKAARDVTLLAQTEVGEVREGAPAASSSGAGGTRRGGSSTLPHKRNPIAAVSAVACAARAPGLVATLMAAMVQEHERAAGAWHAEWLPLTDLLATVGSAAAWLHDCLANLEVDEARMRANLASTGGLLLAERVTSALAPHLGRTVAHDLVAEACAEAIDKGQPLSDVLSARPSVGLWLSPLEITVLLDPSDYLGSATLFVDRALRAHAARTGDYGGSGEEQGNGDDGDRDGGGT
jgi:3-carboxy-cis,cis-muconate cycloisomerase